MPRPRAAIVLGPTSSAGWSLPSGRQEWHHLPKRAGAANAFRHRVLAHRRRCGATRRGGRPTPAWAGCWLFLTPPLFTTSCGALTVPSGGHSGGRRVVSMLLPGSSRRGPPPQVGPGAGDVPHVTLTGTPGSPRVESGAPESGLSRRGLCPCGRAGQEGVVVPAARPWGPAPAAAAGTPRRPRRRPLRRSRKCGTAQPAGAAPTRVKWGWQSADTSQRGRGGPPRGTPGGAVCSGLGCLAPSA